MEKLSYTFFCKCIHTDARRLTVTISYSRLFAGGEASRPRRFRIFLRKRRKKDSRTLLAKKPMFCQYNYMGEDYGAGPKGEQ